MKNHVMFRRVAAVALSLLLLLGVLAPLAFVSRASATDADICIVNTDGERTECEMPAEIALAYAEVLENNLNGGFFHCLLVAPSSDDIPILLLYKTNFYSDTYTSYHELQDKQIWVWNGSSAERFTHPNLYEFGYRFGSYKEFYVLYTSDDPLHGQTRESAASYFHIANGNLRHLHTYNYAYTDFPERNCYKDGVPIDEVSYEDEFDYYGYTGFEPISFGEPIIIEQPYATSVDTASALRAYAGAFSDYPNYEDVSGCMHMVAEDAIIDTAMKDGETCTGIYELIPNNAFYGIIESNGEKQGVLVRNVGKGDDYNWLVYDRDIPPMTPDQLDQAVYDLKYSSNVGLDYNKLSSIKDEDDLTDYLEDVIENAYGTPNDTAINEMIVFCESAISNFCTKKLFGWRSKITLGSRVTSVIEKAREAKTEVEELFQEHGLSRNNPIDIVIPILWRNCNLKKVCRVVVEEKVSDMLQDIELRLYLGDSRHYLQFNRANTDSSYYGGDAVFTVTQTGDRTYQIESIDEYDNPTAFAEFLGVGLPADSETFAALATYDGKTRNTGGQFDPVSKMIFFETRHGGQFEIQDCYVDISDISHLSKEKQDAIRFLVSKEYMTLTDGNFLPEEGLNRYQFAQALVGMFFAWDDSLTTTFQDVDPAYYGYVASGQHVNIIEGYDAFTYGGADAMTVEQMLALASRTLVNKKEYTYPADPDAILSNAAISGTVSDWAKENVALALRDGLWDYDETLAPGETITREQAAVVLYRLFLLLQEVSPLAQNTMVNVMMIVVATLASAAIIVCIILIVILIRKNNEINRKKKGNIQ